MNDVQPETMVPGSAFLPLSRLIHVMACTPPSTSKPVPQSTFEPLVQGHPSGHPPQVARAFQRGFTLIELLVAATVLAILATSAAPSLAAAWGRHSVRNAATALAADLRTAQTQAIASGMTTTVCASLDGQSCSDSAAWTHGWVVFTDRDNNQQPDASESVLRSQGPLRTSVAISNASGGKAPIALSYQGLGFASGVQATLVFWDAAQGFGICLRSDAGRVSVRSAAQNTRGFICT